MNRQFNFPLSGAVTQAINPMEFWFRSASSQLGFINIHYTESSDHQLEQDIIENAASYGRQLGRITDLLTTLIDNPGLKDLTGAQRRSIAEFQEMTTEIDAVKSKHNNPRQLLNKLDHTLAEIQKLKSTDPAAYDQAVQRIQNELGTSLSQ